MKRILRHPNPRVRRPALVVLSPVLVVVGLLAVTASGLWTTVKDVAEAVAGLPEEIREIW